MNINILFYFLSLMHALCAKIAQNKCKVTKNILHSQKILSYFKILCSCARNYMDELRGFIVFFVPLHYEIDKMCILGDIIICCNDNDCVMRWS